MHGHCLAAIATRGLKGTLTCAAVFMLLLKHARSFGSKINASKSNLVFFKKDIHEKMLWRLIDSD